MDPRSAQLALEPCYHGAGTNLCEKTDQNASMALFADFGLRNYFKQDQEEILSTPIEIA